MRVLHLPYKALMLDARKLEAEFLGASHYDRVVREDMVVLKPDGRTLLVLTTDALPAPMCREAHEVLRWLRPKSNSRRTAAGGCGEAPSAAFGFLDRDGREPYCRMTDFTLDNFAEYEASLPFFAAISDKYRDVAPAHYAAQKRFVDGVSPDFVIPETIFSSVTLNIDFRTAAHADMGNRRPGLEAVVALGQFEGGHLVFPRYKLAADLRPGGLLVADMHELHANAEMWGERVSLVCYARAGMCGCGTKAEEWRRRAARQRRGGPAP